MPKTNINKVINSIQLDKKLGERSKIKSNFVPQNERAYGSILYEMGRKAYFEEFFQGIDKKDQDYTMIKNAELVFNKEDFSTVDKIINTVSFNRGYKNGSFLVQIDNIPEEYQYLVKGRIR